MTDPTHEIKYTNYRNIPYHRLNPPWKYRVNGSGSFPIPGGRRLIMPEGVSSIAIKNDAGVTLAVVYLTLVNSFPGYCYNGPNGVPDLPVFMEPAIPHDILNQLMAEGLLPKVNANTADFQFRHEVMNNGAGWLFARLSWRAVRTYQKLTKGA